MSRAISRSQSRMLWRCTSVGCAVSTGATWARANQARSVGVRAAAAVLLLVLGDVEQVREVAERAHQVQRLVEVQRVQLALELGTARRFLVERHGRLADALDALERCLAHLLADHFPQQPP